MSELLEQIIHENGIHEIIFHSEQRQAVDEYFKFLESTVLTAAKTTNSVNFCLLLNFSLLQQLPSFAYLSSQGRKLLGAHSAERPKLHIRGAILVHQHQMMGVSLIESLFKILPIDVTIKPFLAPEREKAMLWLQDS